MPYSRAYNRYMSWKKAVRKRRIDKERAYDGHLWYPELGYYRKGKIHCSCPMCNAKTRNKTPKRKGFAPSINYKHSDLKKQVGMDEQEKEYYLKTL